MARSASVERPITISACLGNAIENSPRSVATTTHGRPPVSRISDTVRVGWSGRTAAMVSLDAAAAALVADHEDRAEHRAEHRAAKQQQEDRQQAIAARLVELADRDLLD